MENPPFVAVLWHFDRRLPIIMHFAGWSWTQSRSSLELGQNIYMVLIQLLEMIRFMELKILVTQRLLRSMIVCMCLIPRSIWYGVCIDSWKIIRSTLYIFPSHHFPTGIITPISVVMNCLVGLYKDENRYIIEDDCDSELRLGGKPIPILQSIDVSDKVIYMNTFTKTLSSTKISYMVLPASLTELFIRKLSFYSCTV